MYICWTLYALSVLNSSACINYIFKTEGKYN